MTDVRVVTTEAAITGETEVRSITVFTFSGTVTPAGGGGGGAVDSVNGETGVVVLTATDVGADVAGAAAAAQAASQPLDSDLTAIAALSTSPFGRALLALADAAAARTAIGAGTSSFDGAYSSLTGTPTLGTAAAAATGDFDAAGAAAAAQAASQPLDSDLTAIAALSTSPFGRSLLTAADAAAARALTGAGTSSLAIGTTSSTAKAGDYQPTAANISDATTIGRTVLTAADAAAVRTAIGAGTSSLAIGTTGSTAKAGDYQPASTNISDATTVGKAVLTGTDAAAVRTTLGLGTAATISATAGGDLSGTLPSPTVTKLNGTSLAGLATGLLKNTTATGVPSIAVAADIPNIAESQVTNLTTDLAAKLAKASNLSDVASASTARTNLGLGTAAVLNSGTASGDIPLLSTGGVLPIARLATGTPTGSKFVRDDGTLATPAGGGSVATDAIFDAKGDLAVGTGADTAAKLTVGADGKMLTADAAQTQGVRWTNPLDAYPMIAGQFYSDPNGVGTSSTVSTSGRLEMRPFPVGVTGAVDQLAAECVTTGTAQYRLGIYDSDPKTGMPKNLIVDAGIVQATATGARTLTVSLSLPPGLYWLAALGETNGTGSFRSWSTQTVAGRLGWSAVVGGSLFSELMASGVTTGALPNPCPTLAGFATTTGIRIFARAA